MRPICTSIYPFLIILLSSLFGLAQTPADFGRTYTDTLPENFKVEVAEIKEHIYAGIPDELKNEIFPAQSYKFASRNAIRHANRLKSGKVYSDWPAFENYINEVLQKVMPQELAEDEKIYAYLLKVGKPNAFMTPAGITFFNIGIFGEMENEAALAGILCHELAHYYLKHSINRYVKYVKGDFKPGFMMHNRKAYSQFSVANEVDADSLAMVWMQNAGYNVNGLLQFFELLERKEKNLLLRIQDVWELKERTHPASKKRQAKILRFIEAHLGAEGSNYLVDEQKFKLLKAKAKPEILKHLLHNFDYALCIETAFKYHLFDTNNATFIYYLMEAIRRKCYQDATVWSKNFITFRYFKVVGEGKKKRKIKLDDHLFTKMPLDILKLSTEMAGKIEAKFYWEEEVKFKTHEEAFLFFSKVGKLLEEPECILSDALSYSSDKKVMNQLLKEYLKQDNIRYRTYAELLLEGKILAGLNKKKLTVLSNFIITSKNGKSEVPLYDNNPEASIYFNNFLDNATSGIENTEAIYLPDLQATRLNDYTRLKELETLSLKTILARGQRTELHILDPRYWQLMQDLGINEAEFINCYVMDIEKKVDLSLDFYKRIMKKSFNDLLAKTERNRFLNVYITSARSVEGGVMKVAYVEGEDKLKFKQPADKQITQLVNTKLKLKQKRALNLDSRRTD